jgi:hypothetical protein
MNKYGGNGEKCQNTYLPFISHPLNSQRHFTFIDFMINDKIIFVSCDT